MYNSLVIFSQSNSIRLQIVILRPIHIDLTFLFLFHACAPYTASNAKYRGYGIDKRKSQIIAWGKMEDIEKRVHFIVSVYDSIYSVSGNLHILHFYYAALLILVFYSQVLCCCCPYVNCVNVHKGGILMSVNKKKSPMYELNCGNV